MIFYTKKKVDLTQQNVIVLNVPVGAEEDGVGYIVLSRDVYDAAIILADRYGGDYSQLEQKITNKRHPEAVKLFLDKAPRQIKILAPFFHLVDEDTELPSNLEGLCGYLHVISMAINFVSYISVPESVRSSVQFSGEQLEAYVDSWDALSSSIKIMEVSMDGITKEFFADIAKSILSSVLSELAPVLQQPQQQPYVQAMPYPVMSPVVYGQQSVQYGQQLEAYAGSAQMQPAVQEQVVEEEDGDDDIWGELADLLGDDIEAAEKELAEAAEKEEEKKEESKKAVSEEELKAQREKEALDKIIGMYGGGF